MGSPVFFSFLFQTWSAGGRRARKQARPSASPNGPDTTAASVAASHAVPPPPPPPAEPWPWSKKSLVRGRQRPEGFSGGAGLGVHEGQLAEAAAVRHVRHGVRRGAGPGAHADLRVPELCRYAQVVSV